MLDFIAFDSAGTTPSASPLPALELDNIAIQERVIPPASLTPSVTSSHPAPWAPEDAAELPALARELANLTGIDGDFELQKEGAAPARPWHPGPNSAGKVLARAQSPYRNHYPEGRLGLHLPNSGSYNGFGQTLTNVWKAESTQRLMIAFDFRCNDDTGGGDGTWRFHLGHSHANPALEFAFNRSRFFRLDGNRRDVVGPIELGRWYHVQAVLNLQERRYTGSIQSPVGQAEFAGRLADNWDGKIDYTFIDSGGHLPGVKPSLDVDNFVVGESPLAPFDARPIPSNPPAESQQARATALRNRIEKLTAEIEKAKTALSRQLETGPVELAYGVTEGTPGNAHLHQRGDPDRLGEEIERGFLKVLGGGTLPPNTQGSGRRELAEWLTHPDHPLTARVMVNRIWQHHFGQGLVKSPNDFGRRGRPPTHPALLDYLASRFVQSGWSVKAMHRLIMSSAVYQQTALTRTQPSPRRPSTERTAAPTAPQVRTLPPADPPDTDYAGFQRRRLSAEEIRDAILATSGTLDREAARGHPFPAPTTWGYTQHGPFSATYDHNKRSIYLMTQRIKRHPFLALFDGADPNASTSERRLTTVPTQALFFLNDPFVHEKSVKLAERLQVAGPSDEARIEQAYRLMFGRSPTASDRTVAADFLAAYRAEVARHPDNQTDPDITVWAAYGRVLIGSNEFLSVD